jgi:uncharacterized protein YdiU (UPF0061 family)
MLAKLGLLPLSIHDDTDSLLEDRETALENSHLDMTSFSRCLSHVAPILVSSSGHEDALFQELITASSYLTTNDPSHANLLQWLSRYTQRLRQETVSADSLWEGMLRVNPKYILRNYLAQKAIEGAEQGNLAYLERLMTALQAPYAEQPEQDDLAAKRPDRACFKPGCATLSGSS